jgi:hypothetical protein
LSSIVRNSGGLPGDDHTPVTPMMPGVSLEREADKVFSDLPNDLARLVYLASIRDYNTGRYLHPELSRNYNADAVDGWLHAYHGQIFDNLLGTPISNYVDQLRLYASFSGTPAPELTRIWRTLEAYKAAVPLGCDRLAADMFNLNMFAALCILGNLLHCSEDRIGLLTPGGY